VKETIYWSRKNFKRMVKFLVHDSPSYIRKQYFK